MSIDWISSAISFETLAKKYRDLVASGTYAPAYVKSLLRDAEDLEKQARERREWARREREYDLLPRRKGRFFR